MYSDGYQDQFGGPKENIWLKNLKLLTRLQTTVDEQRAKYRKNFYGWKGNHDRR